MIVKIIPYFKGHFAQNSECKTEGEHGAKQHAAGEDYGRSRLAFIPGQDPPSPNSCERALVRGAQRDSQLLQVAGHHMRDERCTVSPPSSVGGDGSRTFSPRPAPNESRLQGPCQRRAAEITAYSSGSTASEFRIPSALGVGTLGKNSGDQTHRTGHPEGSRDKVPLLLPERN